MSNPQAERLITFLIENGIRDQKVLDAIYQLPRESFLSQAMYHQAYDNNALPIDGSDNLPTIHCCQNDRAA